MEKKVASKEKSVVKAGIGIKIKSIKKGSGSRIQGEKGSADYAFDKLKELAYSVPADEVYVTKYKRLVTEKDGEQTKVDEFNDLVDDHTKAYDKSGKVIPAGPTNRSYFKRFHKSHGFNRKAKTAGDGFEIRLHADSGHYILVKCKAVSYDRCKAKTNASNLAGDAWGEAVE